MNVLVTGASGFVGRALVDELRHRDGAYEVHPLERSDGDLAEEGVADAAIAEARPDVVVHAAARIGVVRCEDEPLAALRSNVLATALVARACAAHGCRLVYLSTADVYGARPGTVGEDARTSPASLYALTKLWGEQVSELHAGEGLQIARLANPYGPGVEPGRGKGALPTMLMQAQERRPIPVFRGELRTFCWIGDIARAIRIVVERGEPGVFNIGSDAEPIALADAARLACAVAGAPPDLIEEVNPPPGRVATRISVEKIQGLGWGTEVDLEDGLRLLLTEPRAIEREPKADG